MNYKELYEEWLSNPCFDDETKAELRAISDDENEIKRSFEITKNIFDKLKPQGALICSMGMSGDFNLAIECESNMVRLGTILYR